MIGFCCASVTLHFSLKWHLMDLYVWICVCVYFNIDSSSCLTLLFVEIGEFPNHGFSVFFHWFKTICVMQAKHFLLKEREREREIERN